MSRSAAVLLASAAAALLCAAPALATHLAPVEAPEPVEIEVSGRAYRYFPLTSDTPLKFTVQGPAVFEPILRWRFEGEESRVDVDVAFIVDGGAPWHQVYRASAGRAGYPVNPDWRAGRAVRVPITVPSGTHTVELRLVAPGEGVLDVNPVLRAPDVMPWRLAWRCELGAAYDTNIFRYPESDVDDFLDGREGHRYPVEYVDDVRLEPSVDVSFVREEPGRRETELRFSADGRLATINGEKSFGRLGARVKETRKGFAYALADYYAIPAYHLRHLWDADASENPYRSCDFRKHAARVEVGSDRSLPVDLIGRVKYDYMGYDQDFVEYDSDAWTTGLTAVVRPARGLRVDVGYALRVLTARGYDELGETRETSDDSDISYEQDEYTLKVRWDLERTAAEIPTVLTFGAKLSQRFYQTDRSADDDPYHAGREDTYLTLTGRSAHELSDALTLELFYEHRRRSSESEYVEELGFSKDYTDDRVGLRLIFEGERFLD